MVLLMALIVVVLAWAVGSIIEVGGVSCSPQNISLTINDEDGVLDLASALDCSDGTFTVTWVGSLAIPQTLTVTDGTSLTIIGEDAGSALDGRGVTGPLIFVDGSSSALTLRNLGVKRGSGFYGGAISALTSAAVNIVNCTFSENDASQSGGAIYAGSGAFLGISGSTTFYRNTALSSGGAIMAGLSSIELVGSTSFVENIAGRYGGAILISDGEKLTVNGASTFFSNSAFDGGAIYAEDSLVTIEGIANFTGNSAEDQGGAITAYGSSLLSISGDTLFSGNSAREEGGALRLTLEASLEINGQTVLFVNNTAGVYGGAISLFSSSDSSVIAIQGTTEFVKNFAGTNGGAVYVDTAKSVILNAMRLEDNSAQDGFGGAFYVARAANLEVASCLFASNKAAFGGAMATFSSGLPHAPILYSSCTFSHNSAEEDGGAIYSVACYDDLRDTIMDDNFAGGSGGALVHSGEISAAIDVIFSNNLAGGDGPAVLSLGAIVEMANSTFAGNTFFCEPGTYLEEFEGGCRLHVVCSRCFSECISSVATVENEQLMPTCTAAPEHTTALEAGGTVASLALEKGYYRISAESLVILECFNEDACVGGIVAGQYCAGGYTGPYCAVSEKEYASGYAYSCESCSHPSSQAVNAILMIALAILLLLLIAAVKYLIAEIPSIAGDGGYDFPVPLTIQSGILMRSAAKHLVGTMKVVLVVWQITTQFASVTGTMYPGIYQDFLDAIGVLDLDRGLILSSSCLMESNFYDQLLLSTISPFIFLSMLVVTRLIARKRNNRSPRVVTEIDRKHLSALLIIALLIYSTTSTTIFETFGCNPMDDGVDYLRADYRLECNSRQHGIYRGFAAVMIVVYPIGIPLFLGYWIFVNRHALRERSSSEAAQGHLAPFAELWEPYKPERYYWEIVEFTRRMLLTGIGVFIYPNSAAQIAIILLLAAFFGIVFEILDPYQESRDTQLYRAGYIVVLLSIYLALLLRVDVSEERSPSQDVFSIVLILVHCMMILAVVVEGVRFIGSKPGT